MTLERAHDHENGTDDGAGGGRIEVVAPDLPVGEAVEVIIRWTDGRRHQRCALDILAEAPGHRMFKSAQEIDRYIREGDSWPPGRDIEERTRV